MVSTILPSATSHRHWCIGTSAAQKISRRAIGGDRHHSLGDTYRPRPDITQEEQVVGLPFGTRGGALVPYTFPVDGDYDVQVRLARDRNEEVEGLNESHDVEILVDRERWLGSR